MYIKINDHLYDLDHFQEVKIFIDPNHNGTMYSLILTNAYTQRTIPLITSSDHDRVKKIFNVILSYLAEHKGIMDFTDY